VDEKQKGKVEANEKKRGESVGKRSKKKEKKL